MEIYAISMKKGKPEETKISQTNLMAIRFYLDEEKTKYMEVSFLNYKPASSEVEIWASRGGLVIKPQSGRAAKIGVSKNENV